MHDSTHMSLLKLMRRNAKSFRMVTFRYIGLPWLAENHDVDCTTVEARPFMAAKAK